MMSHIVLQKLQRHYIGDEAASDSSKFPPKNAAKKSGFMYRCLRLLPPLGKNTFLLSLLGGGALGSFVMSTTAGKSFLFSHFQIVTELYLTTIIENEEKEELASSQL
mmetsp:Transcript_32138/g.65364  ORF Transcript_32138/g.65364 Transcript_32138/m.65364 type:complete len:107 (-) Transcript_32138:779-1099(-)